jgi:site-specific recombinase XerD
MPFTNTEKKEIEVMMRKEIKNFFETNTIKQFEEKILDRVVQDMKRGKLESEAKEITLKMFREFYQFMWMNRSYWEPRLKNA